MAEHELERDRTGISDKIIGIVGIYFREVLNKHEAKASVEFLVQTRNAIQYCYHKNW